MSKCDKCIHKPICEWVEENFEEFKFPIDENKPCVMFDEITENTASDCCEAKNTAFEHTIEMMRSPNYKERFKAEYLQTLIRYEKLKAFNTRIEAAHKTRFAKPGSMVEEPKHDCPLDVLREQQSIMGQYLHMLELRAVIEGINLHE